MWKRNSVQDAWIMFRGYIKRKNHIAKTAKKLMVKTKPLKRILFVNICTALWINRPPTNIQASHNWKVSVLPNTINSKQVMWKNKGHSNWFERFALNSRFDWRPVFFFALYNTPHCRSTNNRQQNIKKSNPRDVGSHWIEKQLVCHIRRHRMIVLVQSLTYWLIHFNH